jgi:hypothetical protein
MTRRTSSCTRYKRAVTVAKDHELRQRPLYKERRGMSRKRSFALNDVELVACG